MPQPAQFTSKMIVEAVGRALGQQRKAIDAQLTALRDTSNILTNRLLRSAEQGLEVLADECLEQGESAEEFCHVRFEEPLAEAHGEYFFARALSADTLIVRSNGLPLMRGNKGTREEHLRILLLRSVERICGRLVPRGFDDSETANAVFLRAKAERLHNLSAGLSGDPRGDVRSLNIYHMIEDAKALGCPYPAIRPIENKLAKARDSLSSAGDAWAGMINKFGYQPHRACLIAHRTRNDRSLPPAYNGNPIAKACQNCAARFQDGQPYRLSVLREADHAK